MGGPTTPFRRCFSLGRIIVGAFAAARAPAPTDVGDVATMARALIGLRRVSLAILAAARAAVPVVVLHRCCGAPVCGPP
eukprot:6657774-Alexandrium_andersonii.AAC.1